jgi:hypothetical protein
LLHTSTVDTELADSPDIPEIVPYALRSKAMSVYVVTQAVSLAFNQYVNPIALAAIGEYSTLA